MREVRLIMTAAEKKPRTIEVLDLQSGETVSSAAITHTPPSGSAVTMTPTVSTPNIHFVLGAFTVLGTHIVDVQATGSAATASKPVVRYIIEVK